MHDTKKPMPVYFVSHGGGPWPWVEGMREMFARTARELSALPAQLPQKPRAVLMISGHWEADRFSVSTAEQPPMEHDYFGFPPHTYTLRYPAPGSPALAARVQQLLGDAPARFTGHLAYRALVAQADLPTHLRNDQVTVWMGPQLHVVHYPVRSGQWLNLVAIVHGEKPEQADDWDQAGQAQALMQAMGAVGKDLHERLASVPAWRQWHGDALAGGRGELLHPA
jgi:hypothetical protein